MCKKSKKVRVSFGGLAPSYQGKLDGINGAWVRVIDKLGTRHNEPLANAHLEMEHKVSEALWEDERSAFSHLAAHKFIKEMEQRFPFLRGKAYGKPGRSKWGVDVLVTHRHNPDLTAKIEIKAANLSYQTTGRIGGIKRKNPMPYFQYLLNRVGVSAAIDDDVVVLAAYTPASGFQWFIIPMGGITTKLPNKIGVPANKDSQSKWYYFKDNWECINALFKIKQGQGAGWATNPEMVSRGLQRAEEAVDNLLREEEEGDEVWLGKITAASGVTLIKARHPQGHRDFAFPFGGISFRFLPSTNTVYWWGQANDEEKFAVEDALAKNGFTQVKHRPMGEAYPQRDTDKFIHFSGRNKGYRQRSREFLISHGYNVSEGQLNFALGKLLGMPPKAPEVSVPLEKAAAIVRKASEGVPNFEIHQPEISSWAFSHPDNLAAVLIFVQASMQQEWHNHAQWFPMLMQHLKKYGTFQNIARDCPWRQLLISRGRQMVAIWHQRRAIFDRLNKVKTDPVLLFGEVISLGRGFGLPKGGFVVQLLTGTFGCVDSINAQIFGLDKVKQGENPPPWSVIISPRGDFISMARFVDKSTGKLTSDGWKYIELYRQMMDSMKMSSKSLWDLWCDIVATKIWFAQSPQVGIDVEMDGKVARVKAYKGEDDPKGQEKLFDIPPKPYSYKWNLMRAKERLAKLKDKERGADIGKQHMELIKGEAKEPRFWGLPKEDWVHIFAWFDAQMEQDTTTLEPDEMDVKRLKREWIKEFSKSTDTNHPMQNNLNTLHNNLLPLLFSHAHKVWKQTRNYGSVEQRVDYAFDEFNVEEAVEVRRLANLLKLSEVAEKVDKLII